MLWSGINWRISSILENMNYADVILVTLATKLEDLKLRTSKIGFKINILKTQEMRSVVKNLTPLLIVIFVFNLNSKI